MWIVTKRAICVNSCKTYHLARVNTPPPLKPEVGRLVGSNTGEKWLPDKDVMSENPDDDIPNYLPKPWFPNHLPKPYAVRRVAKTLGAREVNVEPSFKLWSCLWDGLCEIILNQVQCIALERYWEIPQWASSSCWFTSACNRRQWVEIVEEVSHPL